MDITLNGLEQICLAYIDDIIVFTNGNEQTHIEAVIKVLQRIKEKGLVLSKKKSKLLQTQVEYLGLKIGENGQLTLTNNIQEKLHMFPDKLENRKQIQRFLGCLNYIAEQGFLKNLAKERRILQTKISEKIPWTWTDNDTLLVKDIKQKVQLLPSLYNPQINDFLIVETDASKDTWAGCLKAVIHGKALLGLDIQVNLITNPTKVNNDMKISSEAYNTKANNDTTVSSEVLKTDKYEHKLCKYISGTFSQAEQNYSTHERETLACLKTLKKWKIDLIQTRFELRTDSKYLLGFWRYKLQEDYCRGRLIRWQLQLHQFSPYLRYIKSENNHIADTLTREWKPS